MISGPYRVGALLRRSFRRILMTMGLEFTEDRGFLDSLFMVTADAQAHARLHRIVERING